MENNYGKRWIGGGPTISKKIWKTELWKWGDEMKGRIRSRVNRNGFEEGPRRAARKRGYYITTDPGLPCSRKDQTRPWEKEKMGEKTSIETAVPSVGKRDKKNLGGDPVRKNEKKSLTLGNGGFAPRKLGVWGKVGA